MLAAMMRRPVVCDSLRIAEGGMMWCAILSVIANSDGSQEEQYNGEQFLQEAKDVEFLGFVEVYH